MDTYKVGGHIIKEGEVLPESPRGPVEETLQSIFDWIKGSHGHSRRLERELAALRDKLAVLEGRIAKHEDVLDAHRRNLGNINGKLKERA